MRIDGNTVRLSFAHAAGLRARDGKRLTEFQLAGGDGKFVDAVAEIDGETIVVSAEAVKSPTRVRFGWHKLANPHLINGSGLPASPFQTINGVAGPEKPRTRDLVGLGLTIPVEFPLH
ncbi:MAG: hypothetical protein ABGX07_08860 [Pirellulaceae bacterium]